jgi:hypothetical protein
VREVFYYQRRHIPYRTYSEGRWTQNTASIMEMVEKPEEDSGLIIFCDIYSGVFVGFLNALRHCCLIFECIGN